MLTNERLLFGIQNKFMTKNIFSFWKIALFGGLLVFSLLFWLNDFVGYSAKSAILINGHNGNQDDVLAKTVASFGDTDVFVKRTLGSTRLQESMLGSMDAEAQLIALQKVAVTGGKKGGLVILTATNLDREVAETVSTESTETLLRMSRVYLGDETEFSATVIDKAIVTKGLTNPWTYTLLSIATALVLMLVIVLLGPAITIFKNQIQQVVGRKGEKHPEENIESLDQRFVPQKLDPTFLYSGAEVPAQPIFPQPKATEVVKSEVYGKSPLQSVSVSMEDLPFTFETPTEEEKTQVSESVVPEKVIPEASFTPDVTADQQESGADKEPSVLEYKRRLNELLAQK